MIALLPRSDGPALELEPSLGIWRKVEKEFGSLGRLYLEHLNSAFRLEVYLRLFFECARHAGENVTYDEVAVATYEYGLYRSVKIADALFEDIFKTKPAIDPVPTALHPEPSKPAGEEGGADRADPSRSPL